MKERILKLAAVLLIAGMAACSEEKREIPINLKLGMYSETYPNQGRSKINFIDTETLEIIKVDYTYKYNYEIRDNVIKLSPIDDYSSERTEHSFRVISDSKFEIGDFYPHPAMGTSQIMIFEK
ncbi:MAG: hypothetical protein LBT25_04635 [Candidatus Symbiothrix sp.]|nr:hypothetical protein [Candidatus Symbiothrix sp.]